MVRLPSRAGPGLVYYAAVEQRLGAVLSNGAAPSRPGRWHLGRPPHWTPGAAILARTEAAQGLPRSTRRSAGSGSTALWAEFEDQCRCPWRRWRRENRTQQSLLALRHSWMRCCGPSTTWVSLAPERRRLRTAGRIPDTAGPRATRNRLGSPDLLAPCRPALPLRASLSETFSPTSWSTFHSLSRCVGKKNKNVLLKTGSCLALWQKDRLSQAEEPTCRLPDF